MTADSAAHPEVLWVTPATERPSGGSLYNRRVLAALDTLGIDTRCWEAPGDWPTPAREDVTALTARLAALRGAHPEASVVVDGLIGAAAPELFETTDGTRPADVLLVHLPAALDGAGPTLVRAEARAVQAASRVVVTSRWTAEELCRSHAREDAEVIVPGVEPPPESVRGVASADHTSRPGEEAGLAVVASLTPRKNHRLLADALTGLTGLTGEPSVGAWRLHLAGPGADTSFGRELLSELESRLPGRVVHHGALDAAGLEQLWTTTDLVLLPSIAETYGMVVTEAAGRGIPAFVAEGTGAVEAMDGAGRALPPDSPGAWREALRRWLTDGDERRRLRDAVTARRDRLPTWEHSAHRWIRLVRSPPTG